jgi:hypothetical protein
VAEAVFPVIPPGLIVQLPAGNPLSTTLPVAVEQSGWVGAPGTGAGTLPESVTVADELKVQPFESRISTV